MNTNSFALMDELLDRLVNIEIGNRGIEPLYATSRALSGRPLVATAADALLAAPEGGTVIATTGSVSRAWISAAIGENDGPSGAAAVLRALWLARHPTMVLVIEEALIPPISAVLKAAGLSVVDHDAARKTSADKKPRDRRAAALTAHR